MTAQPMFRTAAAMFREYVKMERDENKRRKNRAIVSKFFNGAPPFTDAEAQRVGLEMNVNNLFGYTQLATAKGQLMAMYDKPPQFFTVELIDAPAGEKQKWEMAATARWNEMIRKSDRFKLCYGGLAGDSVMHGEAIPHMHTNSDWCPRHVDLSRRLVPSESEAWAGGLPHFAIISGICFDTALFHLRHKSKGWNMTALRDIAVRMTEGAAKNKQMDPEGFTSDLANNVEAEEYARQAGNDLLSTSKLPVVYFYQVRFDKPGYPVDLTIIAKQTTKKDGGATTEDMEDRVIYRGNCRHEHINHVITPIFMGCRLGGESLWHRLMGLGHLNYSIAWHVEALMSRLMQAAIEDATMFWHVADAGARETLEQIRIKHNGIVPEGAELVEHRHGANLNGLVGVLQTLRQAGEKNAMGMASNEGKAGDVLEVQALYEQEQATAARSSHTANWIETLQRLGAEMFRRTCNPLLQTCDAGYSEIMGFQAAMERAGVPLRHLQPENVRVTVTRIAGDGNSQKAAMQGAFILQNIQHVDPHKQAEAKRDAFAGILGDYDRAARYIDLPKAIPGDQQREAQEEDAVMFTQAMLGNLVPLDTTASDVHEEHLSVHFQTMVALITKGVQQKNSWDEEQLAIFKLIGPHAYLHIRTLGDMGKKDIAQAAMQQFGKITAFGDKMANNLMQKNKQQEVNPIEAARLQLDAKKVALTEEKIAHGKEKFERTQSLRERNAATTELVTLERDNREARKTEHEMALNDLETADKIKRGEMVPA